MNTTSTVAPGQNSVIGVLASIYTLVLGLITFCGSLAVVGLGGLTSSLGGAGSIVTSNGQRVDLGSGVSAAGGIVTIIGIALLVIGVALLAVAIGGFMRKSWAYMGTIVAHGIYMVLGILSALVGPAAGSAINTAVGGTGGGFSITSLIFPAISLIIVVLFLTNADVKRSFGRV